MGGGGACSLNYIEVKPSSSINHHLVPPPSPPQVILYNRLAVYIYIYIYKKSSFRRAERCKNQRSGRRSRRRKNRLLLLSSIKNDLPRMSSFQLRGAWAWNVERLAQLFQAIFEFLNDVRHDGGWRWFDYIVGSFICIVRVACVASGVIFIIRSWRAGINRIGYIGSWRGAVVGLASIAGVFCVILVVCVASVASIICAVGAAGGRSRGCRSCWGYSNILIWGCASCVCGELYVCGLVNWKRNFFERGLQLMWHGRE